MGESGFVVDPVLLRSVAEEVVRSAETLREAHAHEAGRLAPWLGAATGWASATASASTAQAWESFLPRLHGAIHDLGVGMAAASRRYADAEEAAVWAQRRARALPP